MRTLLIFFSVAIFVSCSKMGFEKRRYQPGSYYDNYAQNKTESRHVANGRTNLLDKQTTKSDTGILTIVLPKTNIFNTKTLNKNSVFVSAKKGNANYLINENTTHQNPFRLDEKYKSKQKRGLGNVHGKMDWICCVFFGIALVLALLLHYVLFPAMSAGFVLLIAIGIALLVAILLAALVD